MSKCSGLPVQSVIFPLHDSNIRNNLHRRREIRHHKGRTTPRMLRKLPSAQRREAPSQDQSQHEGPGHQVEQVASNVLTGPSRQADQDSRP